MFSLAGASSGRPPSSSLRRMMDRRLLWSIRLPPVGPLTRDFRRVKPDARGSDAPMRLFGGPVEGGRSVTESWGQRQCVGYRGGRVRPTQSPSPALPARSRSGSTLSPPSGTPGPLTPDQRLPHHLGMDRRRFVLTSAAALAMPLGGGALFVP